MIRTLATVIAVLMSITASAQTIERPSVKVGDECHYDTFDNLKEDAHGNPEKIAETRSVVTAVEGDRIISQRTHKILVTRDTEDFREGTRIYDLDLNRVGTKRRTFNPPFPSRFYPLTPGMEKKDVTSEYPRQKLDGNTSLKVDGKASDWHRVVVPAGNFDAITITWSGFYNTERGMRRWSGKHYSEVTLSASTWCAVSGVTKWYRGNGGI